MAPMVSCIKNNSEIEMLNESLKTERNKLLKLRKFVENNFEFVGDKFPRRVREIYYDDKKNKNIYGIASSKEKKDLEEEGIELTSIPWTETKKH